MSVVVLLALQGLLGGVDTLLNHEWLERLPQNERVLHVFLTLNLGAIIAFLVPLLGEWSAQPAALERTGYGAWSWVLTFFACLSAAWAVRDLIAWRRLGESS